MAGTGGSNPGGTGGGSGGSAGTGGSPDGGPGDVGGSEMGGSVQIGCTPALPNSLFCKPTGKMPMSLKDTGVFDAILKAEGRPASLLEYVPDPELWSNGLSKQRFMLLPRGGKIDNTSRENWLFPIGTIFIKTFFDDTGPAGAPRPIETRFIRQSDNINIPFEFFVYQWNAGTTDATLVVNDIEGDAEKDVQVPVTIKRTVGGQPFMVNNGMPFMHTVPSRKACGDCHEANGMVHSHFIGFDELRLNSKFPAAAAKTQLQQVADLQLFTKPIPTDPATVVDTRNDQGRMQRIKRFVAGNCVHCHYEGGQQFDLGPKVFEMVTINQDTMSQSVEMPVGWKRVLPGDPTRSVLYVQMRRTMLPAPVNGVRLRPMPPVGVSDQAAEQRILADVAAWIMSLPRP